MDVSSNKSGKLACAGAGGSLGLAAIAGACTAGCGFAAAPLAAFLTSVGMGTISSFLPNLRIPFILVAVILGAFAMWSFIRRKKVVSAAVCGCVMGVGGALLGWQVLQVNDCKTASTIETVLLKLSPQAKEVLQKGLYPLWPELGRAPTIVEVQQRLGFTSEEPVLAAFGELDKLGFHHIFYPGTKEIKWFWPFSSLDHGVEVTLEGAKPVHARCAIDALGMSAMFGRAAKVLIKSPVDGRNIEMEISGHKILNTSPGVVVSYSDSCDDMLFFSSQDEFSRYVKATGKSYLKLYSLQEALEQGIRSFGRVLKA